MIKELQTAAITEWLQQIISHYSYLENLLLFYSSYFPDSFDLVLFDKDTEQNWNHFASPILERAEAGQGGYTDSDIPTPDYIF